MAGILFQGLPSLPLVSDSYMTSTHMTAMEMSEMIIPLKTVSGVVVFLQLIAGKFFNDRACISERLIRVYSFSVGFTTIQNSL